MWNIGLAVAVKSSMFSPQVPLNTTGCLIFLVNLEMSLNFNKTRRAGTLRRARLHSVLHSVGMVDLLVLWSRCNAFLLLHLNITRNCKKTNGVIYSLERYLRYAGGQRCLRYVGVPSLQSAAEYWVRAVGAMLEKNATYRGTEFEVCTTRQARVGYLLVIP
jgi:hypothetical protein